MTRPVVELLAEANILTAGALEESAKNLNISFSERPDVGLSYLIHAAHCLEDQANEADTAAEEDELLMVDSEYIEVKIAQPLQTTVSLLKLALELTQGHHLLPALIDWTALERGEAIDFSEVVGDDQRTDLNPEEVKDVRGLIAQGIIPFFDWIREASYAHPERTFFEGHALANPISCYACERLGDQTAALVEGYLFTQTAGGMMLSDVFLQFLRKFHRAFVGLLPTAKRLQEWIEAGMPEQPHPFPHDYHEQIVAALDLVVLYIRTHGHLNPGEPTDEECLGTALARYLSWKGNRIGKACLYLCYAAMESANIVPLTELLERLFGDDLTSQ